MVDEGNIFMLTWNQDSVATALQNANTTQIYADLDMRMCNRTSAGSLCTYKIVIAYPIREAVAQCRTVFSKISTSTTVQLVTNIIAHQNQSPSSSLPVSDPVSGIQTASRRRETTLLSLLAAATCRHTSERSSTFISTAAHFDRSSTVALRYAAHSANMGWITRFGNWQGDRATPKKNPIQSKHITTGLLCIFSVCACIAFFPLIIIFVPKPQLTEYMPKGIMCATCKEMWYHNRDLFNRKDMLCYGPPTHDRSTSKEEEVMYSEEKRCWALKKGHDKWMRPLHVSDEETKNWGKQAQVVAVRGGPWP
ncbi:uncharacterized protein M421DRAFT_408699 [Didymella exigua CBS 183.55]|uniref:Uncharacterized protein n=1 Tax=Didymella exigua CBS 183.55 TaxID=1150837 RepID=A0A6A5RW52_9PLEO|nr:uncharacterized protein M421DRAFT_408699 [Didymella exigua CBS 183.55]KAF1931218.1 hypothetical protein M421DRAFT_408699 [Didymella exigua CBS 183.55]